MMSIAGCLMILASGAVALVGEPPETERFRDAPLVRLLPPDAIPAIDAPRLVSREEAERFMLAEEPVLGVVVGGDARAYSLWILDSHEIVNDTLGSTPIAATW